MTNTIEKGIDMKVIIRKAVENKSHWVFEVYYIDKINDVLVTRDYPQVISVRYKRKKDCREKVQKYRHTKRLDFYD